MAWTPCRLGRETTALSTSAQISPAWKQEVNRRLAEHRGRKSAPAAPQKSPETPQHNPSRRALEAAARVAARYANAPSYSEILTSEARAVVRAAEAASRAALHAQAAAESVLAGIEAANAVALAPAPEPFRERAAESRHAPEPIASPFTDEFFAMRAEPLRRESHPERVRSDAQAGPALASVAASAPVEQPVSIRWDEELPAHSAPSGQVHAARGQELFETGAEDWWRPAIGTQEMAEPGEATAIEMIEPVPIPANLIEFPRELVAPRKARPRLAEALHSAPQAGVQLSIFEVDPVALPAEPAVEIAADAAPAWATPAWPGIELEPQPQPEPRQAVAEASQAEAAPVLALDPAPATLRLLAMVVDCALVTGSLLAAALLAASRARVLPDLRTTEIGMGVALFLVAGFYEALFFTFGRTTPGMLYARVRLATFEGLRPTRAERYRRLWSLLVSVLPAGLGVAWSLFDENHLSWHDRLSRTYLCKR